jgi:hypothetical protein
MRTMSIAGTALAVLALGGALSACGTAGGNAAASHLATASSVASSSPGHSAASPPVAAPPDITVVRLSASFSPGQLQLSVGHQFLLIVSPSVQAKGLEATAGCTSGTAAGGLLSVRCTSGGYLYTAEHPGTATISATVRPRCKPGQMCPQWLAEPQLHITITGPDA